MKAQLFENEPRQGVSRFNVKVAVWDKPEARKEGEQKAWPNGYYNNWIFALQPRDVYMELAQDESLKMWQDDLWLGCVSHKGSKKAKGTRQHRDHLAILHPDERDFALVICGMPFKFEKGKSITSSKPKSPIHVWYLDL